MGPRERRQNTINSLPRACPTPPPGPIERAAMARRDAAAVPGKISGSPGFSFEEDAAIREERRVARDAAEVAWRDAHEDPLDRSRRLADEQLREQCARDAAALAERRAREQAARQAKTEAERAQEAAREKEQAEREVAEYQAFISRRLPNEDARSQRLREEKEAWQAQADEFNRQHRERKAAEAAVREAARQSELAEATAARDAADRRRAEDETIAAYRREKSQPAGKI